MQLSKRLSSVASMVTEGFRLADVGTDHGYVPICLYERKVIPRAIAMDINKGPLERARAHIEESGLTEVIETRLSDGLTALKPGEADSAVIAGMGGPLIIKILSDHPEVTRSLQELILQPQSEAAQVRTWLYEQCYEITEEHMIYEDGKYYPMFRAVRAAQKKNAGRMECKYGCLALLEELAVLEDFLTKEIDGKEKILEKLLAEDTEKSRNRTSQIRDLIAEYKEMLERIKEQKKERGYEV